MRRLMLEPKDLIQGSARAQGGSQSGDSGACQGLNERRTYFTKGTIRASEQTDIRLLEGDPDRGYET